MGPMACLAPWSPGDPFPHRLSMDAHLVLDGGCFWRAAYAGQVADQAVYLPGLPMRICGYVRMAGAAGKLPVYGPAVCGRIHISAWKILFPMAGIAGGVQAGICQGGKKKDKHCGRQHIPHHQNSPFTLFRRPGISYSPLFSQKKEGALNEDRQLQVSSNMGQVKTVYRLSSPAGRPPPPG